MIDLGAWASESYRVPVEPSDADLQDAPPLPPGTKPGGDAS